MQLIDNFNRTITYLRISITDRCNLRCVYCMPETGLKLLPADEILTYEELLRIIHIAVELGITKFRLTGGEPLVRTGVIEFIQDAVKVAKNARGISADDIEFSITTNGVLLTDYAEKVFNAGIKRINISLDTLDKEKLKKIIRTNIELQQIIDGIKSAVAVGFQPVKLNVVVMKDFNSDELDKFIEFALENNLVVRFIEHMPFTDNTNNNFLPLKEIEQHLVNKYKLLPSEIFGAGPGRYYRLSSAKFNCKAQNRTLPVGGSQSAVGFIESISRPFCETCNRLRLTSDGKIRLCLGNKYELDIKSALRNGSTDNELKMIFIQAAKSKPERHDFDKLYSRKECMLQIGG